MSEEALKIAVKRREAKGKGEKERYTHLNAEFQWIARRDKKAFLSDKYKEIEESNRLGKTRDLFWRRQWQPTPVLLPGKSMDRGAWWAAVHGVTQSWARLSDFTFTFHFHALEKEMSTHSSVLAWRIPGRRSRWAAVYGVAQSQTELKWLSSLAAAEISSRKLETPREHFMQRWAQ